MGSDNVDTLVEQSRADTIHIRSEFSVQPSILAVTSREVVIVLIKLGTRYSSLKNNFSPYFSFGRKYFQ